MLRCPIDAGQMGISVVCRLGFGLSLHDSRSRRFRFRQRPTPLADQPGLSPSQRTDARLRVELQRCQSAGAPQGDLADLSPREIVPGAGRSWVFEKPVPEVADELYLVGQPQG